MITFEGFLFTESLLEPRPPCRSRRRVRPNPVPGMHANVSRIFERNCDFLCLRPGRERPALCQATSQGRLHLPGVDCRILLYSSSTDEVSEVDRQCSGRAGENSCAGELVWLREKHLVRNRDVVAGACLERVVAGRNDPYDHVLV